MSGELGHKEMTIGMDITPFLTNEKQLESQLNRQTKLMKQQEQYANLTGRGLNSLTGIYNTQKTTLAGYNKLLQQQQQRYDKNLQMVQSDTKANADHQRQLAQSATQLENTKMKIATLTAEMQKNQAQIMAQNSGLGKAGAAMTTFGNHATAVGKGLTSFGKTATAFTLPIMAGLGKAAKSAVEFRSEIAAIGPLLTNGGKITATVQKQLDSMSKSSIQWSKQYGISTTDINNAMSELVKRGFTANQTIGSMGSILDATRASGESMSDVMNVSASVIEQFGLKANTTSQQTKNTQRAVDALTYVANATASDFKTMGDSMSYVGPIASQAGMSIEETAAALGLMANKGIDASTGGTALRAALTRLMTPSKAVDAKMKDLGVNVDAFRKGAIGLPEVIEQIEKGTQGMTKVQKAGAIAGAFGKQALGFTSLLGKNGAKDLRTYTAAAEGSAGATHQVAMELMKTPQAKIDQFKQSLNALGIEMGDKLIPVIVPLVDNLTKLVNKFGELPGPTQSMIVKFAAATALMGPMALAFGKPIQAIGTLSKWLGKLASNKALSIATKEVAKGAGDIATGASAASKGADLMSSGLSRTARIAQESATKTGLFSNVVSKLPGLLGGSALAVAGTAAVVGAGILVWEGWGKKALESAKETRRWGTDVGKANDQVLDKMSGLQGGTSLALKRFSSDIQGNSQTVSDNFNKMSDTISKFAKKSNQDIKSAYKDLDPYLQSLASDSMSDAIKKNNSIAKIAKKQSEAVINIAKDAASKKRDLTSTENQFIIQSQKQQNQQLVKLMGLSAKDQKMVLKSLNGDINDLTQEQANVMISNVADSGEKIKKHYQDQYETISKLEKQGAIDSVTADEMRAKGQAQQKSAMENLASTAYELQLKYGDLNKVNQETGRSGEQATLMFQKMGISLEEAKAAYEKTGKSADKFKDSLVAVGNSKWDQNWNMNFLYDAEKGVMRTKGQLVDFVKQATTSKDKWNNLKLVVQKAKMSTEGVEAVAQGIQDSKAWNKVDLKTWTALLEKKWGTGAKETWDWWINSGQVSKKDIELALAGDYTGVMKVINDTKQWNQMELGTKELFVKDKATIPLIDALQKTGDWQKLTPDEKKLIVNGDMASAAIGMLTIKYNAFDQLPDATKKALLNNDEFMAKLRETGSTLSGWASLPDAIKQILANDDQFQQILAKAKQDGTNFAADALIKKIKADTTDFNNKLTDVNTKINEDKQPKSKYYKADDTDFQNKNNVVNGLIADSNKHQPNTKKYNGDASGNQNAASASNKATQSHNSKKVDIKKYTGNPANNQKAAGASNRATQSHNNQKVDIKKYKGNSTNVVNEAGKGKRATSSFNNQKANPKTFTGHDKASGPARDATREVAAFHRQGDHTVTLTTKKKTILQTIIEKITGKHKAKGDSNFSGGPAIVNDQKGSTYREAIRLPWGQTFIPQGRNVPLNLPKGTQILTARQTQNAFNVPQFKNGTAGKVVQAADYIPRVIEQTKKDPSVVTPTINVTAPAVRSTITDEKLDKVIELLSALLGKNANVYMNMQKIGSILDAKTGSDVEFKRRGIHV